MHGYENAELWRRFSWYEIGVYLDTSERSAEPEDGKSGKDNN